MMIAMGGLDNMVLEKKEYENGYRREIEWRRPGSNSAIVTVRGYKGEQTGISWASYGSVSIEEAEAVSTAICEAAAVARLWNEEVGQ